MMAVIGPYGVTFTVPDIEPGIEFYSAAGLDAEINGSRAEFRCVGQDHPNITLVAGAARKRMHHVTLRADPGALEQARRAIPERGGRLIDPPRGFESDGVWLADPHGTVIELLGLPPEQPLPPVPEFAINAPGRLVRRNRSAVPPRSDQQPVRPLRLGHVLIYTPNVTRSVEFFTDALGMRLADYHDDVVAFMCTPKNSDHHVMAFAKSRDIGFHHASFQVATPDDVGRGGRELADKSRRGDWGFGRHTIGANFFHYIQDPWGSWFEYFADMDFISDYDSWSPTNYPSEDSLYNWGPAVPEDFVHNYEADELAAVAAKGFC